MYDIARAITEKYMGEQNMAVNATLKHPDGRTVKIISGCYFDATYGRLSNFWHWREVMADGSLSETEENGYGWC